MNLMKLDEFKGLFRDEASFQQFAGALEAAFRDAGIVTLNDTVIAVGIGPKDFSKGLAESLADQMTRWKP